MSFVPEDAKRLARSNPHNTAHSEKITASRDFVHRISPAVQQDFEREKKDLKVPNTTTAIDDKTILSPLARRRSVQLEEELSLTQLKKLMRLFKNHRPKRLQQIRSVNFFSPTSLIDEKAGLMDVHDFNKALRKALQHGDDLHDEQVEELFRKVDISSDGLVDWDELSSYILLRLKEKDALRSRDHGRVFNNTPKIVRMHRSKEPTSRILTVYNPTRYLTVSKDGIIRVWNTNLVLQRSLTMEDGERSLVHGSSSKRYMKLWVTDAVVMGNVHKMAVCTTNMDIYFYDMSTPIYTTQFHLCGLGAVSFSMDYYYNQKNPCGESLLFYGDDKGCVHLLLFHTPQKGLFETPFKKSGGTHTVFLQDLSSHSDLVTHTTMPQVHSDWVRRLRYYSSNDILISCSGNGEDTLVVRSVQEKAHGKTYIYRVQKGIDCFDYCKQSNIIATGGMDHVVRIWNSYVTIKPIAKLNGHIARVIDVVIHEKMGKLFSYDSDTVVKTWDIKEHHCLQSIHLKFPYTRHHLEHGPFPVVLLPAPANSLLIACEDYLTELRLDDQLKDQKNQTSHEKPICAALYNANKKQVITGCEDSVVRTWDVETGRKVFEFAGVLGKEEMSCMALEDSGRRLFTGSRNGMVYIWSAGNGHLLHKCVPEEGYECEVTAIQPLPERSYTLSVGWSRRIIMYHDDSEMLTVPADPSWKGGHVHEDDILCIAHCSPNLVATGSFDGDLILWSLERQNIFKRLKRSSGSLFKSKITKIGLTNNRKRPKQENKHGVAVDALLFFERRAHMKDQDSAILVSSQAGVLEFWSMFGPLRPRGFFYAPSGPGCKVLALATDQDNNLLVSGDFFGYITIWDIREYCKMRLEASVTKTWTSSKRQTSIDVNDIPPPQQHKWQGHTKTVISLKIVSHLQPETLLLSASIDCTAKLWTINGDLIGVFGQGQTWDLRNRTEPLLTQSECLEVTDDSSPDGKNIKTGKSASEFSHRNDEDIEENIISLAGSKIRPHTSGDVMRPTSLEDKSDSKFVQNVESLGIERSLTEWSILGDKYNRTFERRMMDRRNRRGNMGHVDTTLTKGGGLGSSCSPFQALHVTTANEFELPRDLPMTPRMVSRSSNPPDETWQRNLASLNLPPISLEEDNLQSGTCIIP